MNGLLRTSIIDGLSCGFFESIDCIRSLNCFEYVGIIDGYVPCIIFIAKAL